MQPPSCWPNPPCRCRTELVLDSRNEKRETKESSTLVSYSISGAKVLQSSMTEISEWLEIEPVKSCVPSGLNEWQWVRLLYSIACIFLSATSIDSCSLSHCMVNKGSSHELQFVKLGKKVIIIYHLIVAEASLEVLQFHYWPLDSSNNS